ncbi:hypothetical protein CRG98_018688 [Punica granatum]|uniref:Uncharacterized protein n=1 Tax=Punica granatum TaxID=22663 RepID=A0A2I0JX87_PUNGR|nr:hypothetical protein CRG98_018688 [Punica granatum]
MELYGKIVQLLSESSLEVFFLEVASNPLESTEASHLIESIRAEFIILENETNNLEDFDEPLDVPRQRRPPRPSGNIEMKISPFKGTSSLEEYLEWVQGVEKVFECQNYTKGQKVERQRRRGTSGGNKPNVPSSSYSSFVPKSTQKLEEKKEPAVEAAVGKGKKTALDTSNAWDLAILPPNAPTRR